MYEILKKTNLSDADAQAFVDEVVSVVSQKFDDKKELLATKMDVNQLRTEMHTEINKLRAEMHREFQGFALKIAGFLIAQAAVIVTLIKLL